MPELLPTMRRKRAREAARSVLPNCTETKLVWSCNLRELRHVLRLRGDASADWEIRRWALALHAASLPHAPSVLGDITADPDEDTLAFGREGI
jgi:thymidylate synthase (FAD)